jgi:hypothetical protein
MIGIKEINFESPEKWKMYEWMEFRASGMWLTAGKLQNTKAV